MGLGTILQEDFSAGAERDVARHLIDPRGAYDIANGLLGEDGSIFKRGGSRAVTNRAFGTSLRWLWDGWLTPGRRTLFASPTAFGVLDADDATPLDLGNAGLSIPTAAKELKGLLFIGGGKIYGGARASADYSTGTVTTTTGSATVTGAGTSWAAAIVPGMLFRIAGERCYVVQAVNSDTQITLSENYEGSTAGGKAYTLKRMEDATAPYRSSSFYAIAGDRLIVIEGTSIVRFSERNKPHSFLTNDFHQLDEGVKVLGVEAIGQNLVIFTTQGIWAVSGIVLSLTDPAGNVQHRLDQLSKDLVLWGQQGITSYQGALVVPMTDGIYLIDAVSAPTRITDAINNPYRDHVDAGRAPGAPTVFRDHLFMPILSPDGSWNDCLVCRLDRPIRSRGTTFFPWTFGRGGGAEFAAAAYRAPEGGAGPKLLLADAKAVSQVISDNFTANSIGAGRMVFEAGAAQVVITAGQLAPTAGVAAEKRGYRTERRLADFQLTFKRRTGPVVTGHEAAAQKRVTANDRIEARAIHGTNLIRINKIVGGSSTTLASAAIAAHLADTDYWLRIRIEGNRVIGEHWTALPAVGGTPAASVTHDLAGGDIALFGAAVSGDAQIAVVPADLAERYDDLIVEYRRARVVNGASFFAPSSAVKYDHDQLPPNFYIVTRDYETGENTVNRIRRARVVYELEAAFGDAPGLSMDIGVGADVVLPLWGQAIWGAFNWVGPDDADWVALAGVAGPDKGKNAYNWYAARRARHGRFRIRSSDPVAKLVIRSIEVFVAVGENNRLAKVR